ncbi:hypothetical protein ACNJ7E_14970 [Rhodococcus sp. NM-2]|uniref:hypothetical protein n=1 Tax=Rhodococcus sp. NM-2 TaxID=3401174 RepID=UPI003AAFFA88
MDSAYSKLSRAKQHLDFFKSEIHAYRARDPICFTYRQRKDPLDSSQIIVEYIALVNEEPPNEWGLILGDILTNLRAALDHTLFSHISARQTLTDQEAKSIQFPILDDVSKWEKWEKRNADWVEPAVAQAILAAQPFKSDDLSDHPVWVLNQLVNYDKHRTLHVVAHRGEATFDKRSASVRQLSDKATKLADNAVIATMKLLRPVGAPGQEPSSSLVKFEGEAGFIEHIDIPGRSATHLGALRLMEVLTELVEEMLDDLRTAGC